MRGTRRLEKEVPEAETLLSRVHEIAAGVAEKQWALVAAMAPWFDWRYATRRPQAEVALKGFHTRDDLQGAAPPHLVAAAPQLQSAYDPSFDLPSEPDQVESAFRTVAAAQNGRLPESLHAWEVPITPALLGRETVDVRSAKALSPLDRRHALERNTTPDPLTETRRYTMRENQPVTVSELIEYAIEEAYEHCMWAKLNIPGTPPEASTFRRETTIREIAESCGFDGSREHSEAILEKLGDRIFKTYGVRLRHLGRWLEKSAEEWTNDRRAAT